MRHGFSLDFGWYWIIHKGHLALAAVDGIMMWYEIKRWFRDFGDLIPLGLLVAAMVWALVVIL